ncbi:hypothetical protein M3Y94_00459000 [Aphelenchoides besseyi]|nr:hypothetical protein M3Y94_00459000 [Aphelenchoides besseyi]KAI6229232.1 hypothetical protein M3Y95_00509500 [Aphelenchoides besseyi]
MSRYNLKRVLFGCIRRPKRASSSGVDKSVQWNELDFVNNMSLSGLNHDANYTVMTLSEQFDEELDEDKCMAVGPAIPFHELAAMDALMQDNVQPEPPIEVFERTEEVKKRLHLHDEYKEHLNSQPTAKPRIYPQLTEEQLELPIQSSNEIGSTANHFQKTPKPRAKISKPAIPRKPSWLKKTRKESPLQMPTKSPNESLDSSKVVVGFHIVKPISQSTDQLDGQNEFQFRRLNLRPVVLRDDDR